MVRPARLPGNRSREKSDQARLPGGLVDEAGGPAGERNDSVRLPCDRKGKMAHKAGVPGNGAGVPTDGYWRYPTGSTRKPKRSFIPARAPMAPGCGGAPFAASGQPKWPGMTHWTTPKGDDPLIPNSQVRGFIGYERELVKNPDLGIQYLCRTPPGSDRL